MYVPAHFAPTEADVIDLLTNAGAIDLVTVTSRGILATMLPVVWDAPGSREGIGAFGALRGHLARKNEQWREPAIGEAMAIVRGPDAYVTPSWYATKREHGRVVPTWNYARIHAYGRLLIHDDPAWVEANVRDLTTKYEAGRRPAWSVDDAPEPYVAGQLRAIVGVELLVDRLEAKLKLSQNRSTEDVDGVIAGLEAVGDRATAVAMRGIRER